MKALKQFYGAGTSYDTIYNYYPDGLLSSVVNANNHSTQYIYDPRGYPAAESHQLDIQDRVSQATNLEGQTMGITYYVGDFVNTLTRFDGSTIKNNCDAAGRKKTIIYNQYDVVVNYDYYADGQVKSIGGGDSAISMAYTKFNQLKSTVSPIGYSAVTSIADYLYDPVGNLTNSMVSVGGTLASSPAVVDVLGRAGARRNASHREYVIIPRFIPKGCDLGGIYARRLAPNRAIAIPATS